jgi:hypothetical protein
LSLLLCLAVVALWVRSYTTTSFLGWGSDSAWVGVLSMRGVLRLERGTYASVERGWSRRSYPTPRGGLWHEIMARDRRGGPLRRLGIACARVDYHGDGRMVRRAVYLPHWLAAAALLAAPAARLTPLLRARRRRRAGRCPACGYDLTANTSGVCPECGRP